MPGSLWSGYLQTERYEQEQEELAEEKKRTKIQKFLKKIEGILNG